MIKNIEQYLKYLLKEACEEEWEQQDTPFYYMAVGRKSCLAQILADIWSEEEISMTSEK